MFLNKLNYFFLWLCFTPILLFSQPSFQLDSLFGNNGQAIFSTGPNTNRTAQDKSRQIAQQSNKKIILAGYAHDIGGTQDWIMVVLRLHPSGILDSSFGINGISKIDFAAEDDECWAVEVQADDKIVLTGRIWMGTHTKMGIVRLTPDGLPDTTFDTDGKVLYEIGTQSDEGFDLAIQHDGKILATGRAWEIGGVTGWGIMRLLPNGQLDTAFNNTGKFYFNSGFYDELAQCVTLQDDGKILIGGSINLTPSIIRLLPNGSLDTSFNSNGIHSATISGSTTSITVDDYGRIIYSAYSHDGLCKTGRLMPDGTTDQSFGNGGITEFNTNQNSFYTSYDQVMLLPDRKILGLGSFHSAGPFDNIRRLTLFLFDENGNILKTFINHPEMQFHVCDYDIWFVDAVFLDDGTIGITSPNCSMLNNYDMLVVKLQYDTLTSAINIVSVKKDITIFPNPSTGEIIIDNLSLNQSDYIDIYNSDGRLVTRRIIDQQTMRFLLPEISGIYFIKAENILKKVLKID